MVVIAVAGTKRREEIRQVVKNTRTMMIVQKGATKEVVESHEDKKVECDRAEKNSKFNFLCETDESNQNGLESRPSSGRGSWSSACSKDLADVIVQNQQPRTYRNTKTESRTDRSSPVQCIWHINPNQTQDMNNGQPKSVRPWSGPTAADFRPIIPTEECHPVIKNARNPFLPSSTDKNSVQTHLPANADAHRRFCVTQTPKISFSAENKDNIRSCTTGNQAKFNSFPRKSDKNRVSATFSSPLRINSLHSSNFCDKNSTKTMKLDIENSMNKQEPKVLFQANKNAYQATFPPPPQSDIEGNRGTCSLRKNEISKMSSQNTSYSPKPVILGNSKKLNISLKSEISPPKKKNIEKGCSVEQCVSKSYQGESDQSQPKMSHAARRKVTMSQRQEEVEETQDRYMLIGKGVPAFTEWGLSTRQNVKEEIEVWPCNRYTKRGLSADITLRPKLKRKINALRYADKHGAAVFFESLSGHKTTHRNQIQLNLPRQEMQYQMERASWFQYFRGDLSVQLEKEYLFDNEHRQKGLERFRSHITVPETKFINAA